MNNLINIFRIKGINNIILRNRLVDIYREVLIEEKTLVKN